MHHNRIDQTGASTQRRQCCAAKLAQASLKEA